MSHKYKDLDEDVIVLIVEMQWILESHVMDPFEDLLDKSARLSSGVMLKLSDIMR